MQSAAVCSLEDEWEYRVTERGIERCCEEYEKFQVTKLRVCFAGKYQ